jgi:hypothetical protein
VELTIHGSPIRDGRIHRCKDPSMQGSIDARIHDARIRRCKDSSMQGFIDARIHRCKDSSMRDSRSGIRD